MPTTEPTSSNGVTVSMDPPEMSVVTDIKPDGTATLLSTSSGKTRDVKLPAYVYKYIMSADDTLSVNVGLSGWAQQPLRHGGGIRSRYGLEARTPEKIQGCERIPLDTEAADLLELAADILERDGWTQGHFYTEHVFAPTERCSLGALRYAAFGQDQIGGNPVDSPTYYEVAYRHRLNVRAVALLQLRINAAYGDEGNYVPVWNDQAEREAAEVLDAMRTAARFARKGEE